MLLAEDSVFRLTFLGTGASSGIPVVNCTCDACSSLDIRDKRFRSSLLIEKDENKIVIDTPQEFRLQSLREGIKSLSAVLYTHPHADHIAGLDDLRPYTMEKKLDIYGSKNTIEKIKERFPYIFDSNSEGNARLKEHIVEYNISFTISNITFLPLLVKHGNEESTSYRFGKVAYMTDLSFVPKESEELLQGVEVLIIDAFREEKHEKHFSFTEAKEFGERIGAKKIYFTHIGHGTRTKDILSKYYPCIPSYDGLQVEVDDE